MRVNEAVNKRIRIIGRDENLVGDVNAAIVVNVQKKGARSMARVSSRQRVVQRRG